ncbi:Short chain dehydrogenase [Phytophthora palmivora]|uniref:Short chain dehydrogenase n=1 Tax=Phytophthora palmivora TaxID=4796 RepID=A0A2P4XGH2_9STRA|nr:Short chain dehydrogenase [Phytophthora palmivora]
MTTTNKTVLITGANRGLGLTFAEHYTKAGWKIIGTVRNVDTAKELKTLSPFKLVQLDASDEASINQMAKELDGVPIDLLINNAGILEPDSYATVTKNHIMRHLEINSVGPFLTTRALHNNLKLAADVNGLAIVASVTSILGSIDANLDGAFGPVKKVYYDNHKLPNGGIYGYRASKAALNMINANLAIDLKKDNIVAVVLQPGYVNTDLTHGNGVVEPKDSVAGMTNVISRLTLDDTSKFYDFQGPELPW